MDTLHIYAYTPICLSFSIQSKGNTNYTYSLDPVLKDQAISLKYVVSQDGKSMMTGSVYMLKV